MMLPMINERSPFTQVSRAGEYADLAWLQHGLLPWRRLRLALACRTGINGSSSEKGVSLMVDHKKAAQGSAAAANASQKFSEMGAFGKLAFIGKACLFFLSMGFAYPNIFLD